MSDLCAFLPSAARQRLDQARDDAVADIARELGDLSLIQIIAVGRALDAYAAEAVQLHALANSPYEWP